MTQITRPQPIMDVTVSGWSERKVRLLFYPEFIKHDFNGRPYVEMTRAQTTLLIAALKGQRKRKGVA